MLARTSALALYTVVVGRCTDQGARPLSRGRPRARTKARLRAKPPMTRSLFFFDPQHTERQRARAPWLMQQKRRRCASSLSGPAGAVYPGDDFINIAGEARLLQRGAVESPGLVGCVVLLSAEGLDTYIPAPGETRQLDRCAEEKFCLLLIGKIIQFGILRSSGYKLLQQLKQRGIVWLSNSHRLPTPPKITLLLRVGCECFV